MGNTDIRSVADAILYEGCLLHPHRSTSIQHQSRWHFGVLGPMYARATGIGEDSTLSTECLVESRLDASVDVTLRFLHLQDRRVERREGRDFVPVDDLTFDGMHWLTWEEAVEVEIDLGRIPLSDWQTGAVLPVSVAGDVQTEQLGDVGRIVRSRHPLTGEISLCGDRLGGYTRLGVEVCNTGVPEADHDSAMRASFIGTHLVLHTENTEFSSLLDPSGSAVAPAATCHHYRCFPVLAGEPGSTDSVLVSPIVLDDYPETAEPIADVPFEPWEIDADSLVEPDTDTVLIHGVTVAKDSLVRVHPSRPADDRDPFFEGRTARVESVHEDVGGDTHVGVVMLDDPAAELHGWYGRFLYFAPDELEPVPGGEAAAHMTAPRIC